MSKQLRVSLAEFPDHRPFALPSHIANVLPGLSGHRLYYGVSHRLVLDFVGSRQSSDSTSASSRLLDLDQLTNFLNFNIVDFLRLFGLFLLLKHSQLLLPHCTFYLPNFRTGLHHPHLIFPPCLVTNLPPDHYSDPALPRVNCILVYDMALCMDLHCRGHICHRSNRYNSHNRTPTIYIYHDQRLFMRLMSSVSATCDGFPSRPPAFFTFVIESWGTRPSIPVISPRLAFRNVGGTRSDFPVTHVNL